MWGFECGWWPSLSMTCFVKLSIDSLSAHWFTAAQKLVNVGLSVWYLCRGFFAAVVASRLASLLPLTPLCPRHYLSAISAFGSTCSILLMIVIASILYVSALKVVFFVDMSLTTPWLLRTMVICLVFSMCKCLASLRASTRPTNLASNIPYLVPLPSWCVTKWCRQQGTLSGDLWLVGSPTQG